MIKTKTTPTLGWIICTLAAIFYCYEFLLRIEPSVMVKELMQTFQANATELGILYAFFYFIYTPMQVIVGLLLDLYGTRRILDNVRVYSLTNYKLALTILPVTFFLGFILTFWLRENHNKK